MYEKARRDEIKNFTGIDDPYETPLDAEITLDAVNRSAADNARQILHYLIDKNFVRREDDFDNDSSFD